MSDVPIREGVRTETALDGVPTEADLVAELAGQERAERRLLARQVTLVSTLVALLLAHVLLG